MRGEARARRILHVDLDPFLVSVERSLNPDLRGRPVVVGGLADGSGTVAAASPEARAAGVRPGLSIQKARRLCPQGVFRPGDLETYARYSQDVTAILLGASRRVERPSSDEAFVDLTRDSGSAPHPVAAAEAIKEEIQRRLGLDASLGLASSRLAARIASTWARPRGLLVVLPGYETSFVARQPITFLPELPPHLERALAAGDVKTIGDVAAADAGRLASLVGEPAAVRLQGAARCEGEEAVALAAPPTWLQEDAPVRDRASDRAALADLVAAVARRAARRLRPFGLAAGTLTVEVRRGDTPLRRSESVEPGIDGEDTAAAVALALSEPLLDPAGTVRWIQVRLTRLERPGAQAPLFPGLSGTGGRPRL